MTPRIEQDADGEFVATDGPRGPRMFNSREGAESYIASGPALLTGDIGEWLTAYDAAASFPGIPCRRFQDDRRLAKERRP